MEIKRHIESGSYGKCKFLRPMAERHLLIELSDSEFEVVTETELREMEKEAMEFDGFYGWRVVGYCDELRDK